MSLIPKLLSDNNCLKPFLFDGKTSQYSCNKRGQLPYMPAFQSYWQPVQVHMKITRNYDIRNNLSKLTLHYDYSKREILTITKQCICRRIKVHAINVSFAIVEIFPWDSYNYKAMHR